MRILVRMRGSGDEVVYVKGRKSKAEGRELVLTSEQEDARIWNTFYAATDFISKSNTKLEGVEIVQLEDMTDTL